MVTVQRQKVEDVMETFETVWAGTDEILGTRITERQALHQPICVRHPFIFYLGHLPAFAWNLLVNHYGLGKHMNEEWDILFERGIDPNLDQTSTLHDATKSWPEWRQVVRYRDRIRASIRTLSSSHRIPPRALRLIIEHEAMHHETLCYMLAQESSNQPIFKPSHCAPHENASQEEWIQIPKGTVTLGVEPSDTTSYNSFKWDNEYGNHVVTVDSFSVSPLPVTVAQFAIFVAENGYTTKEYWCHEAWNWLQTENKSHPTSWRPCKCNETSLTSGVPSQLQWHVLTVDGPVEAATVADWPVYTSLAEARAYATWAGARLLTEAEWMRIACREGTLAPSGNLGRRMRHPVSVYAGPVSWCGVHDLVGNGWEMTNSVFAPYPNFTPMKDYEEYSRDSFDGDHFVLKGASWATDECLVRESFRNFYRARYPYVFSKFRLCR